ncbi:radical SAM/SPASM domain-containing protein [Peribacillus frigoritolerans]|uniref:radical SAM/SPASM domain-containing protein n=1 Tax=Peribacillus frigoritolerans TaxID=450367 RepID=UPI001F4FFA01|nr:radical SAM protein [Peribacillus frigoritolerans]MCK2020674.1 radical SAM protein [Peribacillus frigoritolerans]
MENLIIEHVEDGSGQFRPLVYWYLSLRCNLACKHCWVESSPQADTSADLSIDEILQTIERLKEINPSMVILSGGEPLIKPGFTTIIQKLIDNGINFSVETNALTLSPLIAELFASAKERGVYCWISVSLDGGTKEAHEQIRGPGTFNRTLEGIRNLQERGVPYGVQIVINKVNIHTIPDLFQVGKQLGMESKDDNLISFAIVNPIGRGAEESDDLSLSFNDYVEAYRLIDSSLDEFDGMIMVKVPPAAIPVGYIRRLIKHPRVRFLTTCSFPLLGILPDGTLSVCALTGRDGSLKLGHLREDSFKDVIREKIEPLRTSYERAELTGICGDCVFKESCKGSCRAFAYSETGSFLGPHPLCNTLEEEGLFPNFYRLSYRDQLMTGSAETVGLREAVD